MQAITSNVNYENITKVLVVEDNDGLRELIQKALCKAGFVVEGVSTGFSALEKLVAEPYAVLLLDQKLPDMSGSKLIHTLKEKGIHIPFITMTGHGDERLAVEMMKLGASDYLVKSLDFIELLPRVIRRLFSEQDTERQLRFTETALRDTNARHSAMIANISDVISIRGDDDILKYVSPNIEKWFGWQSKDLVGTDGWFTVHPEDVGRIRAALHAVQKEENSEVTVEYRFRCKNGNYKYIALTAVCIKQNTSINGVLLNYHDITEHKDAEEANRLLQKSESLRRMAGAVAHHFNNQLQAVMLSIEVAKNSSIIDKETDTCLSLAMLAAQKAAIVSSQMLTYLGQVQDKRELRNVVEVCQQSLPLLRAAMPPWVKLEAKLQAPGPIISVNVSHLEQIIANLCSNAWEASDENKGQIQLSIKTVSLGDIDSYQRYPHNYVAKAKSYACLEVTDVGCGIPIQHTNNLFDPFFTTKQTGRGLGLPVILGIVKSHNGFITVKSELGQGSTFRVYFPVVGIQEPQGVVGKPAKDIPQGVTVLVVEDDAVVRKAMSQSLNRNGYSVLDVEDGKAALQLLGKQQNEIGCVVCDLSMPGMSGWQTLEAMRQLVPGIPVILVSGYNEEHVMKGSHAEMPQAFLHKPYGMGTLIKAINSVLKSDTKVL